jgi:hypothetical protein
VASKKTHRKSGRTIGLTSCPFELSFSEDADESKKKNLFETTAFPVTESPKEALATFPVIKKRFFFSWTKWRVLETTNQQLARDIFRPIE